MSSCRPYRCVSPLLDKCGNLSFLYSVSQRETMLGVAREDTPTDALRHCQASETIAPTCRRANMTPDQFKYCSAILKSLKKHRDASPFLQPVDYVKLHLPEYPLVIRHPMDLNTIDRKLTAMWYLDVQDFINDVRLVFSNCYKFNGPESKLSMLCQNVESAFEKGLRQMPPSREPSPPLSSASESPNDTPVTTHWRYSRECTPKRDIHPPPSKDYPETVTHKINRRTMEPRIKFCDQVLRELKKAKYKHFNFPFLKPVDIVQLGIPDYPTIVKHPMDLYTMEKKLNSGQYSHLDQFESDMRLMFNNCYLYNPPSTPVHIMARQLEAVFDSQWNQKPTFTKATPNTWAKHQNENDRRIASLERSIAHFSQEIKSIKSTKRRRRTREPSKVKHAPKRVAKKPKKLTMEEKTRMIEQIDGLSGDHLQTVVDIIRASIPSLNTENEIELDIDVLSDATVHKLKVYIDNVCKKQPAAKRRVIQQHNSKSASTFIADNSSSESDSDDNSGSDSNDSESSVE